MCGRYTLTIPGTALIPALEADGADGDFHWEPVYSIAPRTRAPIVRERATDNGDTCREITLATWGLRPSWAKDKGPRPINARLETAATNGMFRAAFASARVICPMSGYIEWQEATEEGKKVKNPSYVHDPQDELLFAAALMAFHRDSDDQPWQASYTVITRTGEDEAGLVHDRMPVFLTPDSWSTWLNPAKVDKEQAGQLLDLLDTESRAVAATLRTRPISRAINNVRTLDRTDAALLDPVAP